ncbi:MAG: hypothetical protein HY000_35505 [Planctomycetes bacterium]|nr:hypothetical protein [Planctomycetota bacterium]
MYQAGQVQLRTSGILQQYAADRPAFEAFVRGKRFQVFAMQRGLLFLELQEIPGQGSNSGVNKAAMLGGLFGGALGALAVGVIAHSIASSQSGPAQQEVGFDLRSDEELFEIARARKRSFVAKDEEIQSLSIDAPGVWGRFFGGAKRAGWITLRDSCLGKVSMEIRDQAALSVAVDYLPRRFGDRLSVNVELDPQIHRFVPKRQ